MLILTAPHLARPAQADDDHQHPAVSGAQPVSAVVERFHAEFGDARVLEVELEIEQTGGKRLAVYEVKAFTPRGAVLKIYYDARTLKRLSVKGLRDHDD